MTQSWFVRVGRETSHSKQASCPCSVSGMTPPGLSLIPRTTEPALSPHDRELGQRGPRLCPFGQGSPGLSITTHAAGLQPTVAEKRAARGPTNTPGLDPHMKGGSGTGRRPSYQQWGMATHLSPCPWPLLYPGGGGTAGSQSSGQMGTQPLSASCRHVPCAQSLW